MAVDKAAKVLQVSETVLASWENGTAQPSAVALRHMSRLYGVSADWLLGLDG